jgi:CBS domain-containing protein
MIGILEKPSGRYTRKKLFFVKGESTVTEAAKVMKVNGVSSVLVSDGDNPKGIITVKDILLKVVSEGIDPNSIKAAAIMSSPLITMEEDESVSKALDLMAKNSIHRVLVLDKAGKPLGMIVERMIDGDLFDEQRKISEGSQKSKSWLERHIFEVSDSETKKRHV